MRIDPRRLTDLLAIAEHGSYTRAAVALNMSQPALSKNISQLERTLGVKVLTRDRRGAALTEYGRSLVGYARSLSAILARAEESTRLRTLGLDGVLAVGVTPAASVPLVTEAVIRLKKQYPSVAVTITEDFDDRLLVLLLSGEIDLLIGSIVAGAPLADVEEELLTMDPFVLIMRVHHTLARKRGVSIDELRNVTWVLPTTKTACRRQIEAFFTTAGLACPSAVISTNSVRVMRSILARTDWVAIGPRHLTAADDGSCPLVSIPLKSAAPVRQIGIRRRAATELAPPADRLVRFLHEVAEELTLDPTAPTLTLNGREGPAVVLRETQLQSAKIRA